MSRLKCTNWWMATLSVSPSTKQFSLPLALACLLTAMPALAEQPIFGEMPRWAGGWGVQTLHEIRQKGDISSHWVHLEGVYTWQRWIRLTAKVPLRLSEPTELGSTILALPLKRYFNLDGRSGSWTVTPQWFVRPDNTAAAERQQQFGASFSYETEAYRTHAAVSVGAFRRADGLLELHADGGGGINLHGLGSSGHLKLKAGMRWRDDGARQLRFGPILYWRINDRWHAQMTYKISAIDDGYKPLQSLRSGISIVF